MGHTVDGRNPAPPKKSWDASPVNPTNNGLLWIERGAGLRPSTVVPPNGWLHVNHLLVSCADGCIPPIEFPSGPPPLEAEPIRCKGFYQGHNLTIAVTQRVFTAHML